MLALKKVEDENNNIQCNENIGVSDHSSNDREMVSFFDSKYIVCVRSRTSSSLSSSFRTELRMALK